VIELRVKIVSSRVVETPALGGGTNKQVWISWGTDTGLNDAFTMSMEDYTVEKAVEKAVEAARHASEIVGQEVEVK
jgi:hypothetical protein